MQSGKFIIHSAVHTRFHLAPCMHFLLTSWAPAQNRRFPFWTLNSETGFLQFKEPGLPKNIDDCMQMQSYDGSIFGATLDPPSFWPYNTFNGTVAWDGFLTILSYLVYKFRISNIFSLYRVFAKIDANLCLSPFSSNALIFFWHFVRAYFHSAYLDMSTCEAKHWIFLRIILFNAFSCSASFHLAQFPNALNCIPCILLMRLMI